jgi:O-antigen ligase
VSPRWTATPAIRTLSAAATAGAAILIPLLYVPRLAAPFTAPKEAILEVAAALGFSAYLLRRATDRAPRPPEGAEAALAAGRPGARAWSISIPMAMLLVAASGALSAAIAARTRPGASYALDSLLRWVALLGIVYGVAAQEDRPAARASLFHAVTASAAIVSVIGLLQHIDLFALPLPVISTPGSTFGNRNLAGEAVALSLPFGCGAATLAGARWERRLVGGAVALEVLFLAATRARGAWLGGAMGLATVVILAVSPGRRAWSLAAMGPWAAVGALALFVALLPGKANPRYAADSKRLARGFEVVETSFDPDSTALRTRIGLWRRSLAMLRMRPLTGIGPGNWAVLFPAYAEPGATDDGVLSAGLAPRHAHLDLLECLTETGVVGLASVLVLAATVAAAIRRRVAGGDGDRRVSTAVAAGTLVALAGTSATGFPMEMPATLLLTGLALGLVSSSKAGPEGGQNGQDGQDGGPGPGRARRSRFGAAPLGVAVAASVAISVLAGLGADRRIRGSYWLGRAERALHDDRGPWGAERALRALARAEQATPGTFRVALRTAHAELRLHHTVEATRACDAATAREPYSPNAWATLAAVQLDGGDAVSARRSAEWSLELLNDYPYAIFLKAQAAGALGDHEAAQLAWGRLQAIAEAPAADKETNLSARELLQLRFAAPPPG